MEAAASCASFFFHTCHRRLVSSEKLHQAPSTEILYADQQMARMDPQKAYVVQQKAHGERGVVILLVQQEGRMDPQKAYVVQWKAHGGKGVGILLMQQEGSRHLWMTGVKMDNLRLWEGISKVCGSRAGEEVGFFDAPRSSGNPCGCCVLGT